MCPSLKSEIPALTYPSSSTFSYTNFHIYFSALVMKYSYSYSDSGKRMSKNLRSTNISIWKYSSLMYESMCVTVHPIYATRTCTYS